MDRYFATFGKVILVLVLLGAVGAGSYYIGQKTKKSESPSVSPTPTSIPASLPVSATPLPTKTISGGLPKSSGLSFSQYTLEVSSDWSVKSEKQTPAMDEKLTLEKDGYKIAIFQAATGGALCLYPKDADFEGPSSRYTNFVELKTQDGTSIRRSGTDSLSKDGGYGYTGCQKGEDGSFGQPTNYGHIAISTPKDQDKNIMEEIDKIISSLKKI